MSPTSPGGGTRHHRAAAIVPVLDAELDQVYLASEATRRSKLITGFIRAAQQTLASAEITPSAMPR